MAMKSEDLVRLYIGDQLPDTGDEAGALFKTNEIAALLTRFGGNEERVAGVLMLIIANDNAKAATRAQTLNLTIEKTVAETIKASDKFFEMADKTESGAYTQSGPIVTKQGTTGRPLFHKKGVSGVGEGEISDADAEGTDEFTMTPE